MGIEQAAFGICKICLINLIDKESNYPLIYNKLKMLLFTPLEQFQIISLFSIKLFCFDFSITNLVLLNFLVLVLFSFIIFLISSYINQFKKSSLYFIPST